MKNTDIIIDSDAVFEIDPATRAIKNISASKISVVQYDHNSERLTFLVPRMIEGNDILVCDKVEIHYINANAHTKEQIKGVYQVNDLRACEESDARVTFSWLISQAATQIEGDLSFMVRFSYFNDENEPSYVWNTGVFSGIPVVKGMYNGDVIAEQYTDVLWQWQEELYRVAQSQPYIGSDKHWYIYDKTANGYVDSGVIATPTPDISDEIPEILAVNTIYNAGVQTNLTLNLPNGKYSDFIQVDFLSGDTASTLTINSVSGLSEYNLIPEPNMIYSLYFDWGVLYYDAETSSYTYGWRFAYAEYVDTEV